MISIVACENTILWSCLIVWAATDKGVLREEAEGEKKQISMKTKPIGIDDYMVAVFYYTNVTWL